MENYLVNEVIASREEIISAITDISKFLGKKQPAIRLVMNLGGLYFQGENDDLIMQRFVSSSMTNPNSATHFSATSVLKFLRGIPNHSQISCSINPEDNGLTLRCGPFVCGFTNQGSAPDINSILSVDSYDVIARMSVSDFLQTMSPPLMATPMDSGRPALNRVNVIVKDGEMSVTGCDGMRIHRTLLYGEYGEIEAKSFSIDQVALEVAVGFHWNKGLPIEISRSATIPHLMAIRQQDNIIVFDEKTMGYPSIEGIISRDKHNVRFSVHRKDLEIALKCMECCDQRSETTMVRVIADCVSGKLVMASSLEDRGKHSIKYSSAIDFCSGDWMAKVSQHSGAPYTVGLSRWFMAQVMSAIKASGCKKYVVDIKMEHPAQPVVFSCGEFVAYVMPIRLAEEFKNDKKETGW